MVPPLNWLESLCCAACVTATDPVLASSVVGKGKFAKRVPKHLRDILSAESGCNDGMAFPFIYLALYIIEFRHEPNEVAKNWLVITILYECVFGAFYGFIIGYIGRHGIKYAEAHDLVDRESFLVFYFVLALFCAGSGSILGVDDLLVGFSAGVGFSNDGWFTQKTEESHVSNVIDLLLNLAYFVYLGTIIPWEQYNSPTIGTTPWRLVVIAIFVIFFRRIPIMMALKPVIPDIKTWREALFAGHFGPIGVGAIFVAILARAELETESTTPLASYPPVGAKNSSLVALIWPITTFLVISSIIVHGSSIAVFTLGKRINTLSLTMSYTAAGDEGPGWLNRLPRISSVSRSQAKSVGSESEAEGPKLEDLPPGILPPIGIKGQLLRRQKEEDAPSRHGSRASSLIARRRKKKKDDGAGGPISQSAIYPQHRAQTERFNEQTSDTLTPGETPENEKDEDADDEMALEKSDGPLEKEGAEEKLEGELRDIQRQAEMQETVHRASTDSEIDEHTSRAERHPGRRNVYQEGDHLIVEDEDGEVLETRSISPTGKAEEGIPEKAKKKFEEEIEHQSRGYKDLRKKFGILPQRDGADGEDEVRLKLKHKDHKEQKEKRGPALAYQFGSHIIVEDEDGEVVKTYELPPKQKPQSEQPSGPMMQSLKRMAGMGALGGLGGKPQASVGESSKAGVESGTVGTVRQSLNRMGTWGFGGRGTETAAEIAEEDDDRRIRFTIGGAGRRLTKEDFLREMQGLDPKTRSDVITESNAPQAMKTLAKKDASPEVPGSNRLFSAINTYIAPERETATAVGAEMARQQGARVDESGEEDAGHKTTRAGPGVKRGKSSSETEFGESAVERRRREQALRGTSIQESTRGRPVMRDDEQGRGGSGSTVKRDPDDEIETAAEKRRREAALGFGGSNADDSDDDDTPRVPPPVARSRGIRFAQSPVRGK